MLTIALIESAKKFITSKLPSLPVESINPDDLVAIANVYCPGFNGKHNREISINQEINSIRKEMKQLIDANEIGHLGLLTNKFAVLQKELESLYSNIPTTSSYYQARRGVIINTMGNREEILIDSPEKEYVYKVFLITRKMDISRCTLCKMVTDYKAIHVPSYEVIACKVVKDIEAFKKNMRKLNATHYRMNEELKFLVGE